MNKNLLYLQQEISQDWYSGDVIRALELSGSLVPQVLKKIYHNPSALSFNPHPGKKSIPLNICSVESTRDV